MRTGAERMLFGKQSLFGAIKTRMEWLGDRQRILAQNVANADTPGYAPKDLKPLNFKQQLASSTARVSLATTDAAHRAGRPPASHFGNRTVRDEQAITLSGNAVDLETELLKVAETGGDYQAMTNLYQKHLSMWKTAVGRTS